MATWKVEGLYVAQTADQADVVTHVDWACEGIKSIRAKLPLDPPGQPFAKYKDLTQELVLSWVWLKLNKGLWADLDKEAIEAKVDALEAPVLDAVALESVSKPLPWGK